MRSVLRPADQRHAPAYVLMVISAAIVLLIGYVMTISTTPVHAAPAPPSQSKPATASTVENAGIRRSSAFAHLQRVQVDLGASAAISQVVLTWEAAYARSFQIQVSVQIGEDLTTFQTASPATTTRSSPRSSRTATRSTS